MTDRPIIFSAPMIRALLEGRKTMTRRIIKGVKMFTPEYDRQWNPHVCPPGGALPNEWSWWEGPSHGPSLYHTEKLPWKKGDGLWVRENWTASGTGVWTIADARTRIAHDQRIHYAADGERGFKWWPSIHMPREFSRLTLIVEGVKVERLQAMEGQHPSESEAIKEGIFAIHHGDGEFYYSAFRSEPHPKNWCDPTDAFRELWSSLHGADAWAENPWVAAISFRVIKANIDAIKETA